MRKKTEKSLHPQQLFVGIFGITMLLGALLLSMPFAHVDGAWHFGMDSLFIATNCVCVTGLDSVGISSEFTPWGFVIITILSEIGGLGIMTIGAAFFYIMGRRLSASSEIMTSRDLGKSNTLGLTGLIRSAVIFALSWELVAAIVFAGLFYFNGHETNLDIAFLKGIFFSIMGFCNAGMSIHSSSLSSYLNDYSVQIVFMVIATVGGLGFVVLKNIASLNLREKNPLKRHRLSLHARVVLIMTAIIIVSTFIMTYLLERNGAFANLTPNGKIFASAFHATVSRNAGFCTIPTNLLSDATLVWTMLIMFIGGAPGSTAGGIKVTTLAVIIATLHSASIDRRETIILKRTISNIVVRDALVILNVYLLTMFLGILLVSICEVGASNITLKDIAFEVVSATTTTGLSTGITTQLTSWSKFWLVLCMFCGRLGPLTIVMTLARRTTQFYNKYPEENLTVG